MQETNTTSVGISFPSKLLKIIDKDRGDIPTSRYIIKVLKKEHSTINKEEMMINDLNSLEGKTVNLYSSESTNL